jgi:hypothetical protein
LTVSEGSRSRVRLVMAMSHEVDEKI